MEHQVKSGLKGLKSHIVELKDTAAALGSGLAEVYATPSLVALMENTANTSLEPFLPEGYSTVGIEINIKHLKASLPKSKIICESVVTKVDGKKVYFDIAAREGQTIVGTSTHIRYIIHSKTFLDRLKEV